jgi:nucleoid-associated protein YgaU
VAGDTLSEIASRKLGNANRWKEIAKINNIRDPTNIRVGQRLRLP